MLQPCLLLLLCCCGLYRAVAIPQNDQLISQRIVKRSVILIIEPPMNHEVIAGTTVLFRCRAVAGNGQKELKIDWLKNDKMIGYTDSRYRKFNDNSLEIMNTNDLDSGNYTCVASTKLDRAAAKAYLLVQYIPNPPKLENVECSGNSAIINWTPQGDNRSPIQFYTIYFNTSFTPSTLEVASQNIPPSDYRYIFAMTPWVNYTFSVTATNGIGQSHTSEYSQVCSIQGDVPHNNPANVEGIGTEPHKLEIRWSPMPEIEHNGPGFHYVIVWRRNPNVTWQTIKITNWRQRNLIISDLPAYQRYYFKVLAVNDYGRANVEPREVIGYSGEGIPTEAPGNLGVDGETIGSSQAVLQWTKVSNDSVQGKFKGYKIEVWADNPNEKRETRVRNLDDRAAVTQLNGGTEYFAHIMVYNGRYNGPTSNIVSFTTLEGLPEPVQNLQAVPLGPSAFWLSWNPPKHSNGQLTGYKIYYEQVDGTRLKSKHERKPDIGPRTTSAKLIGLEPNTKYRVSVRATTNVGEGSSFAIESTTLKTFPIPPDTPNFIIEIVTSTTGADVVRVRWLPTGLRSGTHFFVKYRKLGASSWEETEQEMNEDYLIISSIDPESVYEIRLCAIYEAYMTESRPQFVDLSCSIIDTFTCTTSELRPEAVESFEVVPIGASGFWLTWNPPLHPNGNLTGYKIYYQKVRGTRLESKRERKPHITDKNARSAKLAGLEPNTLYRIHIHATTNAGEGYNYYVDETTILHSSIAPDAPEFAIGKVSNETGAVKIQWLPSGPRPGSHFFIKYRQQDDPNWMTTKHEVNNDHLIISSLDPESTYEIRMWAVNGEHMTESQSKLIKVKDIIDEPIIVMPSRKKDS